MPYCPSLTGPLPHCATWLQQLPISKSRPSDICSTPGAVRKAICKPLLPQQERERRARDSPLRDVPAAHLREGVRHWVTDVRLHWSTHWCAQDGTANAETACQMLSCRCWQQIYAMCICRAMRCVYALRYVHQSKADGDADESEQMSMRRERDTEIVIVIETETEMV